MRRYLALLISLVAHPAVVGLCGLLLAIRNEGLDSSAALFAIFALVLPSILIPVICQIVMWRIGLVSDFFVTREEERRIYVVVVASILLPFYILEINLLSFTHNLTLIVYMLIGGLFAFAIVNLFMKVSLHIAVLTAVLVGLAAIYGWTYAIALPLIPGVAWARGVLQHHSRFELATGFVVSALIVLAISFL